jgi:hypothetical protein
MIYANDSWWNVRVDSTEFGYTDLVGPRYVRHDNGTPAEVPHDVSFWEHWAVLYGLAHPPVGPEVPVGWSTWGSWQFSADGNALGPYLGTQNMHVPVDLVKEEVFARWTEPKADLRISVKISF